MQPRESSAAVRLVLFTKAGCEKCDYVKKHVASEKLMVPEYIDVATPQAMAEMGLYDVPLDSPLPVLAIDDSTKPIVVGGTGCERPATLIVDKLRELPRQ